MMTYKRSGGIDPLFFLKSAIILVLWECFVDYNSIKFETVQCTSLDYPDKVMHLLKTSEHNQFHIKITFAKTISKAQGQTFNRVAVYLPSPVSPMESCMWHFLDPVRLTALLL